MSWEEHEQLAARIRKLEGKWLLSYQDHPRIRRLYRGRGVTVERLRVTYTLGGKAGRGCRTKELLIRNF